MSLACGEECVDQSMSYHMATFGANLGARVLSQRLLGQA